MTRLLRLTSHEAHVEITGISKSGGGSSVARFFAHYFYADTLEDPSNLGQAVAEYLQASRKSDPHGKVLLSEVEALIAQNLDERNLAELIDQWEPNVYVHLLGMTYRSILDQLRDLLHASG